MRENNQSSDHLLRVGAVNYLNSKPLVYGLAAHADRLQLSFDLPSRLADSLSAGRLDVALIPSIELSRIPGCSVVSDACIACQGPVLSVKLFFRVPPTQVRRLALDEGSRTSAALARVLLKALYDVRPQVEPLGIGAGIDQSDAEAVLLIGDRAIRDVPGDFVEVWDLGDRWCRWAELPFVFAMWVARPGVDASHLARLLAATRDEGVANLSRIAAAESTPLGISASLAEAYLRDNLHFSLGPREQRGLERFFALCTEQGLAERSASGPSAAELLPGSDATRPVEAGDEVSPDYTVCEH